jgi:hypothetical protein
VLGSLVSAGPAAPAAGHARAAVDSLLDSKEELGDFLAEPPSELAEDLLASGPIAPGMRLGRYVT